MNLRTAIIALVCLGAAVGIAGCTAIGARLVDDEAGRQESRDTAIVLRLGDDSLLFVDRDTDMPFVPTAIEGASIIDISGAPIAPEDLAPGNIVRITGDGIMLESYPGQYPGITHVEVLDEGSPEDASAYSELVDRLWSEPDPSQPAYASLDYTTDLTAVSLTPLTNGYTWSFTENGRMKTVTADAPDPVQIGDDDIPDARIGRTTEATVTLDRIAQSVEVTRWSEDDIARAADRGEPPSGADCDPLPGEQVDAVFAGRSATFPIEPGWRYCAKVSFDAGTVSYVFAAR